MFHARGAYEPVTPALIGRSFLRAIRAARLIA